MVAFQDANQNGGLAYPWETTEPYYNYNNKTRLTSWSTVMVFSEDINKIIVKHRNWSSLKEIKNLFSVEEYFSSCAEDGVFDQNRQHFTCGYLEESLLWEYLREMIVLWNRRVLEFRISISCPIVLKVVIFGRIIPTDDLLRLMTSGILLFGGKYVSYFHGYYSKQVQNY